MESLLKVLLTALSLFLVTGTALNLSKHPHWFIRAWDFPRVFVAAIGAVTAIMYGVLFHSSAWDFILLAALSAVIIRQVYLIYPYTPIAHKPVKQSSHPAGNHQFKLLISNVLMENENYDKWLKVVQESDADIVVAVEVNQIWLTALAAMEERYPHKVYYPLENYYGMALFSRLEIKGEPEIRFLVQDDVPSVHLTILLGNGQPVRLHAIHPRPPEPLDHQDSTPRDAELVILGKEIAEQERTIPTVVCGDLNDVAWSFTTQLFLRLSKLLDPRKGRGFYNSFSANSKIFRYPLDHVFHSNELELVDLRVMDHVGSDHFPIFIHLSADPEAKTEQDEPDGKPGDEENAAELVEEQADREEKGEEEGHVAGDKANA